MSLDRFERPRGIPLAFRSLADAQDHYGRQRTHAPELPDEAGAIAVVHLMSCGKPCCPRRLVIRPGGKTETIP
jgi:hypothetical protein